ncbi:MAG: hypothetical protein HY587_05645 [Candidatus Omnitrophica bacterium]|nr:hypothetical protein [Candidatus Omnitrophota bacterium]
MEENTMKGSSWDASGSTTPPASKRMRFAADFIDLLIIPAVLGGVFGVLLLTASDLVRDIVLTVIYVGWVFVRDLYFSPGRWMVGLKLISLGHDAEISLFGFVKLFTFKTAPANEKPSLPQVFWRNFWIYPYILVVGYIVELVGLFVKSERFMDLAAKTRVVQGR